MKRKGILDFNRHHWIVRIDISSNSISQTESFQIWSDNLIDYRKEFVDRNVNCELVLINSMGREVDPLDLTKNLSGSKWYAIIDEVDLFQRKENKYILKQPYTGCPELGSTISGSNLQIKVITSTDSDQYEILSNNPESYWKKID